MVEKDSALARQRKSLGKVEMIPKVPLTSMEDLATFYTPGVAYPCIEIEKNKNLVYEYTSKSNMIAIVSDGTRVLGLGNIGPEAGLPVMEGKAILFKKFGAVDAVPLCIGTTDEDEIVRFVEQIAPTFGAINIEDIESPKAFRVVERAQKTAGIPIFHDDQQGTAVVTVAALINALKLAGKGKDSRIVINGSGAAGLGVAKLALYSGFSNIVVLDSIGAIYKGRKEGMNDFKAEIAERTNVENRSGGLAEMAKGADVLIGLSKKGIFTEDIIRSMAERPIVFALANPEPEIGYDEALSAGAYVVATGSSEKPNQVNNVVAFPGIMRGLLDVRASGINEQMLHAAAVAIADGVGRRMTAAKILPCVYDKEYQGTAANVAVAVAVAAMKTGAARVFRTPDEVREGMIKSLREYARFERRRFAKEGGGNPARNSHESL